MVEKKNLTTALTIPKEFQTLNLPANGIKSDLIYSQRTKGNNRQGTKGNQENPASMGNVNKQIVKKKPNKIPRIIKYND